MALLGQQRRDTETNWLNNNPVLADGEIVLVKIGASNNYTKMKIGNGVDTFSQLPYIDLTSIITFTR